MGLKTKIKKLRKRNAELQSKNKQLRKRIIELKKTFILLFDPGPNWDEKKEIEEQDYWDKHVKFVDKLFKKGKVVIKGPIIHYDRIVIIYDENNESEIRITFKDDPFIKHGVLYLESVMEWNIRLDQRTK